jgi:CHAD domain-containing protein
VTGRHWWPWPNVSRAPVTYGARSKAERGYALCSDEAGQPVRAASIPLDISATSSETFTAIGLSCLKQLLSNREALIDGEAEGVHQMRVGLRRLRAAISLFEPLLRHADTEAVKRELKWLTDQLGPARDYEDLIGDRLRPLRQAEPDVGELRVLNQELRTGAKRASTRPGRRSRVMLRIAVKKLRYGSDFFASLFGSNKQNSRRKAFEKALTSLQDSLGTLNDIEVHRRLAKSVVHARRPIKKKAEKSFAMGYITGGERKQVEKCLAHGRNAGRELAAMTPFWR